MRPYLNWIEERSTKPNVVGSSPAGRASELDGWSVKPPPLVSPKGTKEMPTKRIATPVDWLFAPEWLTIEQACFLSGLDAATMAKIIREDGVDLDDDGRIEKQSLLEFQEAMLDVLNWCPSSS